MITLQEQCVPVIMPLLDRNGWGKKYNNKKLGNKFSLFSLRSGLFSFEKKKKKDFIFEKLYSSVFPSYFPSS